MERRNFIQKLFSYSVIGTSAMVFPTREALAMLHFNTLEYAPHNFKIWNKELDADLIADKKLDLAIEKRLKIPTPQKKYQQGEGKNGIYEKAKKHFLEHSKYISHIKPHPATSGGSLKDEFSLDPQKVGEPIPTEMSSPISNLIMNESQDSIAKNTQSFRNAWGALLIFVEADYNLIMTGAGMSDQFILVHPVFAHIPGNPFFTCHGTVPVEKPVVSICKDCRRQFVLQIFCYNAVNDSMYGNQKIYNQYIWNDYCPANTNHVHNGVLSAKELYACTCYDNIPVKVIDKGNFIH